METPYEFLDAMAKSDRVRPEDQVSKLQSLLAERDRQLRDLRKENDWLKDQVRDQNRVIVGLEQDVKILESTDDFPQPIHRCKPDPRVLGLQLEVKVLKGKLKKIRKEAKV